jgi:hypothetical protein
LTIEELRAAWREKLFSEHAWEFDQTRQPADGILEGVWLKKHAEQAPYGAYLKPTARCDYPAAAHEKIVSDLAFDLRIPVAPVLLSDCKLVFKRPQLEACISLVTHPSTPTWPYVLSRSTLASSVGNRLRAAAREQLSLIAVLDLWIENSDRDNPGNIVYGDDGTDTRRNGFVAIDHASSLGGREGRWRNGGWRSMNPTPLPKVMVSLLDVQVMLRVAENIASFPDSIVESCVGRIPDRYMNAAAKKDAVSGLVGRKNLLSALVSQIWKG